MSGPELRVGLEGAYRNFYAASSIASRFPLRGKRHRAQWLIYNLFMRRASRTENISSIVAATAEPDIAPMPSILPVKRKWRAAVLEAAGGGPGPHMSRGGFQKSTNLPTGNSSAHLNGCPYRLSHPSVLVMKAA
jgi:hypothetical protein